MPLEKHQRMDKLDQTAFFFPVQKDKQSVPVLDALVQDQGLQKEQVEVVRISTASAVPMAQEKTGAPPRKKSNRSDGQRKIGPMRRHTMNTWIVWR